MGFLDEKGLGHFWDRVKAALAAKQDALKGLPGQVVGFNAAGGPVPVRGWSNPQLLINWDFRKPVNRNGKASYPKGNSYGLDRWKLISGADGNLSIEDGCVRIDHAGTIALRSIIEYDIDPEQTYTLSFLVREIGLLSATGTPPFMTSAAENYTLILKPANNSEESQSYAGIYVTSLNASFELIAAKLELGGCQTLARQNEDGEWEIIDPPNYDLQYALCSLYSPSTGEWVGSQHSNLNLLDNAYWASKDAIINQQGQDKYAGSVYGIDRWFAGASLTLDLLSNSIKITSNGTTGISVAQKLEPCLGLLGSIATFSILTADGELLSGTGTVPTVLPSTYVYFIQSVSPINARTRVEVAILSTGMLQCAIVVPNGNSIEVIAAKLELGPAQTLARQDADGNWVLNDPPPNKALELAKCQRYYEVLGIEEMVLRESTYTTMFPYKVTKRASPSVSLVSKNGNPGKLSTYTGAGWVDYDASAATVDVEEGRLYGARINVQNQAVGRYMAGTVIADANL